MLIKALYNSLCIVNQNRENLKTAKRCENSLKLTLLCTSVIFIKDVTRKPRANLITKYKTFINSVNTS